MTTKTYWYRDPALVELEEKAGLPGPTASEKWVLDTLARCEGKGDRIRQVVRVIDTYIVVTEPAIRIGPDPKPHAESGPDCWCGDQASYHFISKGRVDRT